MKFADWDEDGNGSLSVKELCGAIKDLNVKCSNVEFKKKMKFEKGIQAAAGRCRRGPQPYL